MYTTIPRDHIQAISGLDDNLLYGRWMGEESAGGPALAGSPPVEGSDTIACSPTSRRC
jgi:hypothetical protein